MYKGWYAIKQRNEWEILCLTYVKPEFGIK